MKREFDIDWPHGHETMSGRSATIIKRDMRGLYPLAVVLEDDNEDTLETYFADGSYLFGAPDSLLNLRNRAKP